MNRPFETEPYRTGSRQYMQAIAGLWAGRWWWTIILPIVVFLILAGTIDIVYAFVALIMLFIIVPMVMSFLYFYYALTPESIMAMRNKRLSIIKDDGITVIYEPDDDSSRPRFPPVKIKWDELSGIEYRTHDIILHLKGSRYRFIIIPFDAIGDNERQEKLAEIFAELPFIS